MLYRLIIADDEPIVCKLLTQNINWNEIGFEIVALLSDGEEVINFLSESSCDVILCDIKMIKVSGIELAEYVYNNRPEIKVILFSGYRDFENAVSALKYNVENYLLKPLKVTELIEIFKVLKNKLDNEKSDFLYKKYMLREILTNFKNGIFNSVDKLKKQLAPFNLSNITDSSVASFKIKLNSPYECAEENILANTFQNFVDKNQKNISAYFLQGSCFGAEYIIISETDDMLFLKTYAEKIAETITEFIKIKASVDDFIYYSKGRELINLSSINNKLDKQKLELFENQLIKSVNSNNKDDALAILDAIFVLVSENDAHALIKFIEKIVETIVSKLKREDIESMHFISYLQTFESIDKIKDLTKEYFVEMSNHSDMQNDLSRKSTILWARNYIEEHCCEDLTLEKVASIVYLAPTYFSKLFKNITGQNYIDFLISCRMNIAKKLLITTNMKVSEIGNRVGYANASFFNRLFKVNCGITPTEYRIKYAKGRN